MITKIISGAQTGADLAGLVAAKHHGLETGGWMPKGFKAQDGNHPEFAELYGIKEHNSPNYPPRTACNVRDSDGTVRFAIWMKSPGEILTLKMIQQYRKPHFDINPLDESIKPIHLVDWINEHNIQTLNVAGNSDNRAPGIGEFVEAFLYSTFEILCDPSSPPSPK